MIEKILWRMYKQVFDVDSSKRKKERKKQTNKRRKKEANKKYQK